MKLRRVRAVVAALSVAFVAAACGSDEMSATTDPPDPTAAPTPSDPGSSTGPAPTDPPVTDTPSPQCEGEKVVIGLGAPAPDPTQAMYSTIPIGLGYWEAQGLDVEIVRLNGGAELVNAVIGGQVDIGIGVSGATLAQSADVNGTEKTPLMFYTTVTGNIFTPFAPLNGNVKTLEDLFEARIAEQSVGSPAGTFIRGLAALEGLDPTSLKFVVTGTGADAAEFLRRGEIDAFGLFDGAHERLRPILESDGIEIGPVDLGKYKDLAFLGGAYAMRDTINDRPDVLECVGRGIAMGTAFAEENPENAVRVHFKVFPDVMPAGVDPETAVASGVVALNIRLESMPLVDGLYGNATDEMYQGMIDVVNETFPANGGVTADDLWDASYIESINEFVLEQVQEDANSWTG